MLLQQRVELAFKMLDLRVLDLEVLIEPVALGNKLLFPLPEPILLEFHLLREALAQGLLLFLELGVVVLLDPGYWRRDMKEGCL